MAIDDLKLSDPEFFATGDVHGLFAELRKSDPIHLTKGRFGRDFWSLTRHADIRNLFRDPERFSSQRSGPSLPTTAELADPKQSEHARLQQMGAMLPTADPPRHGKLRAAFADRFVPNVVNAMEPKVRVIVGRILDDIIEKREVDFAREVAARLPSSIIFALMGIPEEDWDMMFRFANMHTAPQDPEFSVGTPLQTRQQGAGGSIKYCRELGLKRRGGNGDDLISAIANARIDGELLSDDEVGFNGHMFVIGGQDTTRNSVSAGVLEMIRRPELMQQFRENPSLMATAPDEFIRWATPVAHLLRTATSDFEFGGKQIRENDWVVGWMVSGNRDEEVFANPGVMDIARAPNPHLSFGFGPHFCMGAFLARLEIRILMELLLQRVERIELTGEVERISAVQFCGIKHLPVRITPRARAA